MEDGFELNRRSHGMEVIGDGLVAEEAAVIGADEGEYKEAGSDESYGG